MILSNVWVFVTEACNLKCQYCFNSNSLLKKPKTFTLDNFKKAFDKIFFYYDCTSDSNERIILTFSYFIF